MLSWVTQPMPYRINAICSYGFVGCSRDVVATGHTYHSLQFARALSDLPKQGVRDRDVSEYDVIVEGSRFADAVHVVERVEPRPHDAAGAVGWEIIKPTVSGR